MLKKCNSLAIAEAIIGLTIERVNSMDKFKNMDATVECFDNCREQGLVIINYVGFKIQKIAVTKNRNSDDIVVYIYEKTGWNNLPAENEWDNRKFFKYNEYSEAMNYIVDSLIVDEKEQ